MKTLHLILLLMSISLAFCGWRNCIDNGDCDLSSNECCQLSWEDAPRYSGKEWIVFGCGKRSSVGSRNECLQDGKNYTTACSHLAKICINPETRFATCYPDNPVYTVEFEGKCSVPKGSIKLNAASMMGLLAIIAVTQIFSF